MQVKVADANIQNFNPRSRMGSDWVSFNLAPREIVFQSTLPHGERPAFRFSLALLFLISIHAPAWGATTRLLFKLFLVVFQSTLPHGERHAELRRRHTR